MAKLGYTWYPKDWGNSESVFELNLSERGLYREIIDLAMLNDNKTEFKKDVWCRKFSCSIDELDKITAKLVQLGLIIFKTKYVFVPSCENRLNLVRGGQKGGKNKPLPKPNQKPIVNPSSSLEENNDKPYANQIENKTKTEIKKETKTEIKDEIIIDNSVFLNESLSSEQWLEATASHAKITLEGVKVFLNHFDEHLIITQEQKNELKDYKMHFSSWLRKQDVSMFNNGYRTGTNQI